MRITIIRGLLQLLPKHQGQYLCACGNSHIQNFSRIDLAGTHQNSFLYQIASQPFSYTILNVQTCAHFSSREKSVLLHEYAKMERSTCSPDKEAANDFVDGGGDNPVLGKVANLKNAEVKESEMRLQSEVLSKQEQDLAEYRKRQRERWMKSNAKNKLKLPQETPSPTSTDDDHTSEKIRRKHIRFNQKSPSDLALFQLSPDEASKDSAFIEEIQANSHPSLNDLPSADASYHRKNRRKRQRMSSESGKPENKRITMEVDPRELEVLSPVIIDLDPITTNDHTISITSDSIVDTSDSILETTDMELVSESDEDVVILVSSSCPATSRESSSPCPGTRRESPCRRTSRESPHPGMGCKSPRPGTSRESPHPGTGRESPRLGTSRESPCPGTSRESPRPGTSRESPRPGTSRESPHLGMSRESPRPGTSRESPRPGMSRESPCPGTSRESPRPGTSSESPLRILPEIEQNIDTGEDDVMYMGTIINLVDSPPGSDQESQAEVSPKHRWTQSPNTHPTTQPNSNRRLPELQVPSSSSSSSPSPTFNSRTVFNQSSSNWYYSTARSANNFTTVTSSFSSFMSAAVFGNALVAPQNGGVPQFGHHPHFAASTSLWDPSRRSMAPSVAFGQPTCPLFHGHASTFGQTTSSFQQRSNATFRRDDGSRGTSRDDSHGNSPRQQRLPIGPPSSPEPLTESKLRNRSWVSVDEELPSSSGFMNFTVVSYNVLAQNLLRSNIYLYDQSDKCYLEWRYRSRNLLAEIAQYSPDVLCLQEVTKDHYDDFFQPELEQLGYSGCYKKRTRDMYDGCATFYKDSQFTLDVAKPLEYLIHGDSVLDRDNVGLIVRLLPKKQPTSAKLIVANTHLLFNPRRGDVKLAQLVLLLSEVDRLAHMGDCSPFYPKYHPTVLLGDLNSEPWSPLYQFLTTGVVNYEGQSIRFFSGQAEAKVRHSNHMDSFPKKLIPKKLKITDFCQDMDEVRQRFVTWEDAESANGGELTVVSPGETLYALLPQQSGTLRTFLPFSSVYKHKTGQQQDFEVTTHHGAANCTVDYIFFAAGSRKANREGSKQQLRLVRRLELLTNGEMKAVGPLPNKQVSSDHILLGAAFQLKL